MNNNQPSYPLPPSGKDPKHEALKDKIRRDTEEFLARGGKITVIPPGVTAADSAEWERAVTAMQAKFERERKAAPTSWVIVPAGRGPSELGYRVGRASW